MQINYIKNKNLLKNRPAAIFDMDGTLIEAETVDEIARRIGKYEEIKKITSEGMKGNISFRESIAKRIALLKGTPKNLILDVVDRLPLMPGAVELCRWLLKEGFALGIITGGFEIAAKNIASRLGIGFYIANKMHFNNKEELDKITLIVEGNKGEAAKLVKKELLPKTLIAIGDGSTDIPMLKEADLGIAFCAKEIVKKKIPVQINERSLVPAIKIIKNKLKE